MPLKQDLISINAASQKLGRIAKSQNICTQSVGAVIEKDAAILQVVVSGEQYNQRPHGLPESVNGFSVECLAV